MLRRLGQNRNNEILCEMNAVVSIKDASYPVLFSPGLEFNSPAHGCWNIVHTGMTIPEAHQIYVCADNCMRGVVLTAAEMNAADRFSFVIVEEENLLNGNLEDVTIEGVTDVIYKLKEKRTADEMPKAILLFTVCLHHFLGCDLERVYSELEERFPELVFLRCYMDPIMQKQGPTPDQKLRKAMFEPLKNRTLDTKVVSILGSDFQLDENSDLKQFLAGYGYRAKELQDCKTWEEYESLSEAGMILCTYPSGKYGTELLAERLNRRFFYMPSCFDYDEITGQFEALARSLGISNEEIGRYKNEIITKEIKKCEVSIKHALEVIGKTKIAIDATVHPRPLGLAKYLTEHGFCVQEVYLDAVSPEEKKAFEWLKIHTPELKLKATIRPEMRVLSRDVAETGEAGEKTNQKPQILAIGQKAAWFTGSRYFVNQVQGAGMHGFAGIRKMAEEMERAYLQERDPKDLIVRKGWGCESCI